MKKHRKLVAFGTLAAVSLFAAPSLVFSYVTLPGTLGIGTSGNGYQRDVRIFNNAADAASNNNTTPNSSYPGALGAAMAIWKGARAWSSDTANVNLPGGVVARNFDMDWQGTNTSNPSNQNTVDWISCGPLAYTETPISDGWRIRFCDNGVTWSDGPGTPSGGQIDIQGVMAHEYGHALGLDHPDITQPSLCNVGCNSTRPTMCSFICSNGNSERDIATDDYNGLNAKYGAAPGNKPTITSLSGSFATGGTLVINGTNFGSTVNVKFTAGTTQNTGTIPGVVYNVPASATQVSVTIPAAAQDGNVLVWMPGSSLLSNAFPIDINFVPPPPPSIASVSPGSVQAFQGGVITLTGSGFTGATQVNSGGVLLTSPFGFQVVNDNTITYNAPTASALGSTNVNVTTPNGTSNNGSFNYVETNPPKIAGSFFAIQNTPYTWSYGGGSNDIHYLIYSLSPTTFDFQGTPVLLNLVILFNEPLDGVGLGDFTITIPGGTGGIVLYTQGVTIDDQTLAVAGASNILTTTIF